jgi:hypothetical protein
VPPTLNHSRFKLPVVVPGHGHATCSHQSARRQRPKSFFTIPLRLLRTWHFEWTMSMPRSYTCHCCCAPWCTTTLGSIVTAAPTVPDLCFAVRLRNRRVGRTKRAMSTRCWSSLPRPRDSAAVGNRTLIPPSLICARLGLRRHLGRCVLSSANWRCPSRARVYH